MPHGHLFAGDVQVSRFTFFGIMTTADRDTATTALTLAGSDAVLIYNSTTARPEYWDAGTSAWLPFSGTVTASSVTVTPSGNLTSTDVQAALQELQTDIDTQQVLQAADYIAGAGAPAAGDGLDGNYYLNVTSGDIFGPKAAGAWPGVALGNAYQLGLASAIAIETDDDTGAVGVGVLAARDDHKHPRDQEANDLRTSVGTATNAQNLGTFTGLIISDNGTVKAGMQELESAHLPYIQTFAAGGWGAAASGYYTITVAIGTHDQGVDPTVAVESGTGPWVEVTPDQISITAAGAVSFRATETPDGRFAGRVKITN